MTHESTTDIKTATFVTDRNGNGSGKVYRLDPPLTDGTTKHEYVWVSATDVPYTGPETYIFGSDEHGRVTDWLELDGSYRGGLDHEEALRGAGYAVTP